MMQFEDFIAQPYCTDPVPQRLYNKLTAPQTFSMPAEIIPAVWSGKLNLE